MNEVHRALAIARELQRRASRRRIETFYPDAGALRRGLYPKHLAFFDAGREHRERLMLAANRVGKSEGVGAYEVTCHLTGRYPDWWTGHRFTRPISAWAAGDTTQTVRDIIQRKLLGPANDIGTGMIPGDLIGSIRARSGGVSDAKELVYVRHVSGGWSELGLKSYDQGRVAFQGTEKDLVWLDEEPPMDVYSECVIRTMTTQGHMLLTFTPLLGLSEVVMSFLPGGKLPEGGVMRDGQRFVVMATWDDAPHLSEDDKTALLASIPPYQRDARTKGIPQLGSGAIYPIPESELVVPPFEIPKEWPRGYGLDVGWNFTAAVWGAWDEENDTVYLYDEYKRSHAEPVANAQNIRIRGEWMTGAIDPASMGSSQKDGSSLFDDYVRLGLNLIKAENAVEAGIHKVFTRMTAGRLRVFSTLQNWLGEYRIYRRDEKGKVVKEHDHLMDASRYLVATPGAMGTMPLSTYMGDEDPVVGIIDYDPFQDQGARHA